MSDLLFYWFTENHMKVNKEKCYIINLWKYAFKYITEKVQNSKKLVTIVIDSKLIFKDHMGIICTKIQCQIKCFEQSARLITLNKKCELWILSLPHGLRIVLLHGYFTVENLAIR